MKTNLNILFLIFYTSFVYSSELPSTEVPAKSASLELSSSKKNDSSFSNRKNLKYQMSIAFVGIEYSGVRPLTLSSGMFLNQTDQILLRYTMFTGGIESRNLWIVTIGDRHYLGNSFNVMGSLYWGRDKAIDNLTQTTYTTKELGAGVRVGNEWQWENFTMGCDWFGINHSLIKNQKKSLPNSSSTQNRPLSIHFTFASFYLGYSF